MPEKIAQKKGISIVICINEFQQIAGFKDSKTFQKQLRTMWQLQQSVSYCLFGSKKHLMNELFEKKILPFYKFGDVGKSSARCPRVPRRAGFSNRDGVRVKEYLKLYIVAKPKNKETLRLAEEIRAAKQSELNHSAFGLVSPVKQRVYLYDYFQSYIDTYTKKDIRMIIGAFDRFKDFMEQEYPYRKEKIRFDELTPEMIKGYVEYLQAHSVGEGALGYYQRFKKVINSAVDKSITLKSPCNGIRCLVDENSLKKDVLSLEEIQQLTHPPLSKYGSPPGVPLLPLCRTALL